MSQSNLTELARRGDSSAIAILLSRALQIQEMKVKVDWHGGQLNIRLLADQFADVDKDGLIAIIQQQMQTLQIDSVASARVFAYQQNDPVPFWSQFLVLPPASALVPAATPAIPPAPSPSSSPTSSLNSLLLPSPATTDRFLVCGLGSLGQYCVLTLKRFAVRESQVHVMAIDRVQPKEWEVRDLPALLAQEPIIGDCRNDDVLLNAGIAQCRTILIVTSNETVNVETAIAARRLNPHIRIVMRSSRQNLNQLLQQQLGNFIAFEPTELPAPAFALAGLQEGILGFFNVGNYRFQVVEQTVSPKDYRFDGSLAVSLHKRTYRLLSYLPANLAHLPTRAFYQWKTETRVSAGDRVAYIELLGSPHEPTVEVTTRETLLQRLCQSIQLTGQRGWRGNLEQFGQWLQAQRVRQVVAFGLSFAIFLWAGGSVLLKLALDLSWQKAISIAFILLLGGYGDVFGGLEPDGVPGWVQFLCGLISVASIASVLGVLGLITDNLLSSRFEFFRRRPTIPRQNHVVVIGFGRIGQRVAAILREFKQPVVAMTERLENSKLSMQIPLVVGDIITELPKVNLANAKSVVVVTDDQMLNLEVALMAQNAARQFQRSIGLVIRTYDQRFRDNLNNLLPDAKALAAFELSAEAFTGAAFGENILGLFRLNNRTVLVTEYEISEGDTLVGKSLFQVAYGYNVVPIFHHRAKQPLQEDWSESILPSDERQLHAGDRLVVLASINGLRRIEHGEAAPPRLWRLEAQNPLNPEFKHYCGNDLARISGCSLAQARDFMDNLPGAIDLPMYDFQAYHLVQELSRKLPMTLVPLS